MWLTGDCKIRFRSGIKLHLLLFILSLITVGLTSACQETEAASQQPAVLDNRIAVANELESFYQLHGGEKVIGAPLAAAVINDEGSIIQYFEGMRLDFIIPSDTEEEGEVVPFPIGSWALEQLDQDIVESVPETVPGRYFPETEFNVSGEFLTFFEANGSESLLGFPISPVLFVEGKAIQYFENARLEMLTDGPDGIEILVSSFGAEHYANEMSESGFQEYVVKAAPASSVDSVIVAASAAEPILFSGQVQTITVLVNTTDDKPVHGLVIDATLLYDDTIEVIDLGKTDNRGRLQRTLDDLDLPPEKEIQVMVRAYGSEGQVIGSTRFTFDTWW